MKEDKSKEKKPTGPLGENPDQLPKPDKTFNPEYTSEKNLTAEDEPVNNPQKTNINQQRMENLQGNLESNREENARNEENDSMAF